MRAGRNTVVSETHVSAGGVPILYGETTFQRLPRRDDNPGGAALTTVRHLGKARTETRLTGRVELCDVGNERLVAQGSCVAARA